jgi:hypothetical protein
MVFLFNIYYIKNNKIIMSKPWFHINSVTYSSPSLTVGFSFGRLRGDVFGNKTITIDGFSGSLSFTEDKFYNTGNEIFTFSVGALGTNSNATYTDPSGLVWTFAGSPAVSTNAKPTLAGQQLTSFTASNTNLRDFLSGLASAVNTSATNTKGVVAGTTSTTITFNVPNTGNMYNSTQLFMNLAVGAGSLIGTSSAGVTNSATFSGGATTYNLSMTTPAGGYIETFSISSNTASVLR